jgi:pimeloyl-ACP methyl ester carboxylesterase
MLPGVGHVSQIEAPEAVAAGVAGLWDEVGSGKMAGD